jgi:D-alanyl-D-alanine carboxypeptidase (penicillin-binding protein 5/6)
MRVVHPSVYMKQLERGKKKSKKRRIWYVLVVAVVLAYSSLAFLVTPTFKPIFQEIGIEHRPAGIEWPTAGSASIGELHSKRAFSSRQGDVSMPSASTIKLLTALVVLEQKPLGPTEQGEAIYFGPEDTQRYNQTVANGGAALLIPENTTITYREALDALLVDSANNIAESWQYGRLDQWTIISGLRRYSLPKNLFLVHQ